MGAEQEHHTVTASFGEILRERRVEAGIGLSRFAGMAGLLPSALAAIEHGRAWPAAAMRKRLADILVLPPERRRQLLDAPCDMPDKRIPFFS